MARVRTMNIAFSLSRVSNHPRENRGNELETYGSAIDVEIFFSRSGAVLAILVESQEGDEENLAYVCLA